jgi:hypothetical protein
LAWYTGIESEKKKSNSRFADLGESEPCAALRCPSVPKVARILRRVSRLNYVDDVKPKPYLSGAISFAIVELVGPKSVRQDVTASSFSSLKAYIGALED